MDKIERYKEIERRGLLNRLPADKQARWAEYKRRHPEVSGKTVGLSEQTSVAPIAELRKGLTPGQRAWRSLKHDFADMVYGAKRGLSGATFGASDWALRKLGVSDDDYLAEREAEGLGTAVKGAGFVSELGGNMLGAGGALVKSLGKAGLKGLKLASTAGGIEGAATGLTGSDSLDEVLPNMAVGAVTGAAVPVGLHYGAMGTKWAARPLTDKIVPTYKAAKSILDSKVKLNNLTFDPKLSNMQNIWKKVTGKGDTIDDVINQENQRLARQSAREAKIVDARRIGNETQIRGYGSLPYSGELGESVNKGANGNVGLRLNRWSPNNHLEGVLETPLSFNEYGANPKNAQMFSDAMTNFKKTAGAKGEQVYQYPVDEYSKMRLFLSDDGKTGFAIKPDGDIVSVFNGNNRAKGAGDAIMEAATSAGGKKLDAYDTFLPEIYSRHGFKEVGRDTWKQEFAPNNWDKSSMRRFNLGEPDVVYMEHDPKYYGSYQSPNSLQRVVNRLNDNISKEKDNIKNIWKAKATKAPTYSDRSFLEALADENKRRTMRNGVLAGEENIAERAKIVQDKMFARKNGMYDQQFEDAITIPELRSAKSNYNAFMNKHGREMMPEAEVNKFYSENPIAQGMIEKAREINPSAFKGIKPGSLAEFDELKRLLNAESKNVMSGESASVKDAYKRASNDLKTFMDNNFKGFRDVNTKVASAETAQDIFESKLGKGLTQVGGSTAVTSPFWSGITSPLTAAGVVGGAFNPISLAATAGMLGGKAIWRAARRNAARRLADGVIRTPISVNINPALAAGLYPTAVNNFWNGR